MATINLFIHSPGSAISSERRLPSTVPLHQLKGQLERITGVPPMDQVLSLHSARTDDPDVRAVLIAQLQGDDKSLEDYGVREGMSIKVQDTRPAPLANQFLDDSQVEKFELSEEAYAQRRDTVLAYKQRNKMGRFDPSHPSNDASSASSNAAKYCEPLPPDFKLGARCEVDTVASGAGKRGTVRFIGETEFGAGPGAAAAGGKWIGVEYDEPVGKNDGSVAGKRYFSCRLKYGGFARPDKVKVGDYPEEEIDLEDDDAEL
ncbi:hypothetical protein K437DRAFT_248876 [Tilletiaria anomala UBC 951]|uniref:CAP-Gly domain-containing protein n=1 Tax=Tilletiaria anomala (strain ATCC 24038 / CBS 436.72 / UBC 951) TaxID=1037660 RepID=A0A066VUV9_TILAU|nr:uncharacterized protein K437DRAFT_248876 [Tilletiaria anomala UBC 951]KDN42599.1 hypothetical protein K437DRAFT_248876 [Tilletiaria anomala UBC 951]